MFSWSTRMTKTYYNLLEALQGAVSRATPLHQRINYSATLSQPTTSNNVMLITPIENWRNMHKLVSYYHPLQALRTTLACPTSFHLAGPCLMHLGLLNQVQHKSFNLWRAYQRQRGDADTKDPAFFRRKSIWKKQDLVIQASHSTPPL